MTDPLLREGHFWKLSKQGEPNCFASLRLDQPLVARAKRSEAGWTKSASLRFLGVAPRTPKKRSEALLVHPAKRSEAHAQHRTLWVHAQTASARLWGTHVAATHAGQHLWVPHVAATHAVLLAWVAHVAATHAVLLAWVPTCRTIRSGTHAQPRLWIPHGAGLTRSPPCQKILRLEKYSVYEEATGILVKNPAELAR